MRDNSIYVISAFLCTSAIPSKWINFGKCDISFLIVCCEECFKLTLPAKKIIHVISLKNKSHFHTTLHIFSDWWYIAEYLFEKNWGKLSNIYLFCQVPTSVSWLYFRYHYSFFCATHISQHQSLMASHEPSFIPMYIFIYIY